MIYARVSIYLMRFHEMIAKNSSNNMSQSPAYAYARTHTSNKSAVLYAAHSVTFWYVCMCARSIFHYLFLFLTS